MDYVNPKEVAASMMTAALSKSSLPAKDLLVRGALSGALLAISVCLALFATSQTGFSLAGAFIFPVGFVIIVILGLELVTGSFALVPLAYMEKKISLSTMLRCLFWVFAGNLIGSVLFASFYWAAVSESGTLNVLGPVEKMIVAASEKKTIGYGQNGFPGLLTAFIKAILCNWMVCMGVVMAMTSKSTLGKIIAAGIPIFIFFALGYEHAVVNMFVIPAGMMFGAEVSMGDWWFYNQIIVTLGNIVGGLLFTGIAIYYTFKTREEVLITLTEESELSGDHDRDKS